MTGDSELLQGEGGQRLLLGKAMGRRLRGGDITQHFLLARAGGQEVGGGCQDKSHPRTRRGAPGMANRIHHSRERN